MPKDTFWFKHDYNARNDERILELRSELGAEAYGIFWMVVETMAENDNGGVKASLIGGLSHGFGVAKDRLKQVIDFCISVGLFFENEGYYFSNRLLRHKKERQFFSEMGKEGAERKKQYRGAKGGLNRGEEKREEKIKGINFLENCQKVKLSNGEIQDLGEKQKELVLSGDYKPENIYKGSIY